ncbi:MAG: hypothetical protein VB064_11570 [Oscillospiraceae bacterium]|nr:hypothetical protein [Oscillospiraceae bacterium]
MKKIELLFLAAKIEWHWWFIRQARRRGNSLLSREVPLSSQKLYRLNRSLSAHSVKAINAQSEYEKLV